MNPMTLGGTAPGELLAEREASWASSDLGRVERTCKTCGKEWIGPDVCRQGACRGIEFDEKSIHAKAMVITGDGIGAIQPAAKPRLLVSQEEVDQLRQLRSILVAVEGQLTSTDATMREVVNRNISNFNVFGRIQEVLNLMGTPGDFAIQTRNPLKALGLLQMVKALIGEIDRSIEHYEKEKGK